MAEPIRTVAYTGISGAYALIGTALKNPSIIPYLLNATDALLMFSIDGVNDHLALPANGGIVLDLMSNKGLATSYNMQQGSMIYVKTIGTPTLGAVYLSTFYGSN